MLPCGLFVTFTIENARLQLEFSKTKKSCFFYLCLQTSFHGFLVRKNSDLTEWMFLEAMSLIYFM